MLSPDLIARLARRYLWWMDVPTNDAQVDRLVIQIMDIGDFDETKELLDALGTQRFCDALKGALPGQIRPKSWAYWHYRLGLINIDETPPRMPVRAFQ